MVKSGIHSRNTLQVAYSDGWITAFRRRLSITPAYRKRELLKKETMGLGLLSTLDELKSVCK
jgi:hypothetical protein